MPNQQSMSKKLTQLAEKSIQLVAAVPNKNLLIHRSIEQLAQLEPAPTAISDTSTSTKGQILLANKGIDAERIARTLQSIDLKSTFEPLEALDETDLDGYLQHQHDVLILTAIEEAKRATSDEFHTSFMQQMEDDWDVCKRELMAALTPSGSFDEQGGDERSARLGGAGVIGGVRLPGDVAARYALDPIDASRVVARPGAHGAPRSTMSAKMINYARVIAKHNEARRVRSASATSLLDADAMSATSTTASSSSSSSSRTAIPLVHELAIVAMSCDTDDSYRRTDIAECYSIICSLAGEHQTLGGPVEAEYEPMHKDDAGLLKQAQRTAALRHLERQFSQFVRQVVDMRSDIAQVGGAPTQMKYINGFVRILMREASFPRSSAMSAARNGDNLPVWPLLFYALRCGAYVEANEIAELARGIVREEVVAFLAHRVPHVQRSNVADKNQNDRIGVLHLASIDAGDVRGADLSALRQQLCNRVNDLRRRTNADVYEIAVLNLLSQCDPTLTDQFIFSSAQDFVWFKLSMIGGNETAVTTNDNRYTLGELQSLLLQYNVAHFNADGQTPLLFCQLLLLTQQFERAVSFLRSMPQFQIEAVHIAIALYHYGLLRAPPTTSSVNLLDDAAPDASHTPDEIASSQLGPNERAVPPKGMFNFPRLIRAYVTLFSGSDPLDAVQYLMLLRDDQRSDPPDQLVFENSTTREMTID